MTKKILVTGASGFIASHTIIELLSHGYDVRGTVRDLDRADQLKKILAKHSDRAHEIELVQASLLEKDCWRRAVAGCDSVLHIASPVILEDPINADDVILPAKIGTLNVLEAAFAEGINKVVMTSSVAAVAGHAHATDRVQSEKDWTDLKYDNVSAYAQSKTIAERAAWQYANSKQNFELVTINPSMVLGPALEADYGTSLEAILKLMRGDVPLVPKLGFGIVDVRDVASLHRIAMESDQASGQRLLCSKDFVWFKKIALQLRAEFPSYKSKIPRYPMPNMLVRFAGLFDKVIASIIPDLNKVVQYDCSPAHALGWNARSTEEAIFSGAQSLVDFKIV